jgi:hypothetical protein
MATVSHTETTASLGSARREALGYPASSLTFDWVLSLLGIWMLAGLFLDGWAHNTLRDEKRRSSALARVLYSGMLAIGGTVNATHLRNLVRAITGCALPRAYSFRCSACRAFSGMLDFLWHNTLGLR